MLGEILRKAFDQGAVVDIPKDGHRAEFELGGRPRVEFVSGLFGMSFSSMSESPSFFKFGASDLV